MTLIFAPCFLAKNRVSDCLKVEDPKKISGRPDKLDIRVQIDWASVQVNIVTNVIRVPVLYFEPLCHFLSLYN